MQNVIETLTNCGATFTSFLYRSKKTNELARYTVILGGKYINMLEKSKLALELDMKNYSGDMLFAAQEVMKSIDKSIAAHKNGTQSEDYTKKGQYTPLGNGVNINDNDGSIQVFGQIMSKVVIEAGEPQPKVNSKPLTINKKKVSKELPLSKFREFAFDINNIHTVKVDGETLVLE